MYIMDMVPFDVPCLELRCGKTAGTKHCRVSLPWIFTELTKGEVGDVRGKSGM